MDVDDESEEMQYLKVVEKLKFKDKDYDESNQLYNRVKQFTFVREEKF
jgi:hypothetical protein